MNICLNHIGYIDIYPPGGNAVEMVEMKNRDGFHPISTTPGGSYSHEYSECYGSFPPVGGDI